MRRRNMLGVSTSLDFAGERPAVGGDLPMSRGLRGSFQGRSVQYCAAAGRAAQSHRAGSAGIWIFVSRLLCRGLACWSLRLDLLRGCPGRARRRGVPLFRPLALRRDFGRRGRSSLPRRDNGVP